MLTNRYLQLFLLSFVVLLTNAQNNARKDYIEAYSQIAVDEMNRSGIPASITLAQGILESGNGLSELAKKSNNHFGIKCHGTWTGEKVYHDDDAKGECFRAYKEVRHSYKDHSDFLVRGSRYEFLFELDPTDYKGWAKGLKKAGYATAPDYADKLIRIIEESDLQQFDKTTYTPMVDYQDTVSKKIVGATLNSRGKPIKNPRKKFLIHRMKYHENGTPYIVLQANETIEILSDSLKIRVAVLLAINDATYETKFEAGEVVYIDHKKARSKEKYVIASEGSSMRSISQQHAISLNRLYRYNDFPVGRLPQRGEQIRLRPVGLLEKFKD